MRRVAAILAVLVMSCSPYMPNARGIKVVEGLKLDNQAKAMLLTQKFVEDSMGFPSGSIWQDIEVFWSNETCTHSNGSTGRAVKYNGKCYAGIGFNCRELYVALSSGTRICGTALAHELTHCVILEATGDADKYHTSKAWDGTTLADEGICARGW